jgi:hypothetical protein
VARFLFEFHAGEYQALGLAASTASSGSIHKLLKTDHVSHYALFPTVHSKSFKLDLNFF